MLWRKVARRNRKILLIITMALRQLQVFQIKMELKA